MLNSQSRGSSDLFYWKVYYKKKYILYFLIIVLNQFENLQEKVYSVKKYIKSRQTFQKIIFLYFLIIVSNQFENLQEK